MNFIASLPAPHQGNGNLKQCLRCEYFSEWQQYKTTKRVSFLEIVSTSEEEFIESAMCEFEIPGILRGLMIISQATPFLS